MKINAFEFLTATHRLFFASSATFNFRRTILNLAATTAILICASAAQAQMTFSNNAPITIPESGAASPYPSNIAVSGLNGSVVKATVTLNNFSRAYPSDVGVLLVAPKRDRARCNLMRRATRAAKALPPLLRSRARTASAARSRLITRRRTGRQTAARRAARRALISC